MSANKIGPEVSENPGAMTDKGGIRPVSIETKDSTRTIADVGERQIDHRSLAAALISDASEVIALAAVSMAESVRAYGETIKALREGKSIPIVETPYADILVDRLRGCGVLDDEEES